VGSGNPEKLELSAAIKKYPGLGKAEDVKAGLAKQNTTKIGNYTVSAPMSGQEASPGFKTEDSLNEWANSHSDSNRDEQFIADLNYMTKVISGGLNNIKQDQTTLPSTRVAATDRTNSSNTMAEMLRKLSGIN
jgi:hypothetical protein